MSAAAMPGSALTEAELGSESVTTRISQKAKTGTNQFLNKEDEYMVKKFSLVEQNMAFVIKGILFLSLLLLPASAYALAVGDKTPDFRVITIQGKEISYDKDIKGEKPVYLFFWATW